MLSLLSRSRSASSLGVLPASVLLAAALGAMFEFSVEPSQAGGPMSTDRPAPTQLAQAAPSSVQYVNEKDAIQAVISGYYDAFGQDSAAASAFFGEPTLIVAPNQFVLLNTRADVEAFLERVSARLKPGGFSHSTLSDRRLKLLTSTTALCGGVAIRMKADGTEMQRSGFTYLLQKGVHAWRIHEIIVTDIDKLIAAD